MTQQRHHALPTSARQHHHQHDLGAWRVLPDQQSDSEVHYRSVSGAERVPLKQIARLGYTATYIADFNLKRARHHQQHYGTLHQTS
jgi:hypothetical protein